MDFPFSLLCLGKRERSCVMPLFIFLSSHLKQSTDGQLSFPYRCHHVVLSFRTKVTQKPLGAAQQESIRDLPLVSPEGWALISANNALLTLVPLVPLQPPKNCASVRGSTAQLSQELRRRFGSAEGRARWQLLLPGLGRRPLAEPGGIHLNSGGSDDPSEHSSEFSHNTLSPVT